MQDQGGARVGVVAEEWVTQTEMLKRLNLTYYLFRRLEGKLREHIRVRKPKLLSRRAEWNAADIDAFRARVESGELDGDLLVDLQVRDEVEVPEAAIRAGARPPHWSTQDWQGQQG